MFWKCFALVNFWLIFLVLICFFLYNFCTMPAVGITKCDLFELHWLGFLRLFRFCVDFSFDCKMFFKCYSLDEILIFEYFFDKVWNAFVNKKKMECFVTSYIFSNKFNDLLQKLFQQIMSFNSCFLYPWFRIQWLILILQSFWGQKCIFYALLVVHLLKKSLFFLLCIIN